MVTMSSVINKTLYLNNSYPFNTRIDKNIINGIQDMMLHGIAKLETYDALTVPFLKKDI